MACIFYYKPCCENHIPTGTKKHGIAGGFFQYGLKDFGRENIRGGIRVVEYVDTSAEQWISKDKGRKNILPTFVLLYVFMLLFHT